MQEKVFCQLCSRFEMKGGKKKILKATDTKENNKQPTTQYVPVHSKDWRHDYLMISL